MTNISKGDPARCTGVSAGAAQKGSIILKSLAPSLRERGVPSSSFIMVNINNGEFVTGKSPKEVGERFELMHPGEEGWMQRIGEVIGDPEGDPADASSSELGAPLQAHDSILHARRRRPDRPFALRGSSHVRPRE